MALRLLGATLAVLTCSFALDLGEVGPVSVNDTTAQKMHSFLRRKPNCTGGEERAPKVLHHIWWQGESALPPHFLVTMRSWIAHHSDWKHMLWDEAAVTALANESYPWFVENFLKLPSKIQQADSARYMILHAIGGVYADVDIECLGPFDDLINSKAPPVRFFEEPVPHWKKHNTVVSNSLIVAPKGHKLMRRLLEAISSSQDVFGTTGSHMIQSVLKRCLDGRRRKARGISCGCYDTVNSADFFPLHAAMLPVDSFVDPIEHMDEHHKFIDDLRSGNWPHASARSMQYWSTAWIDPDIGKLFWEGITSARAGHDQSAITFFKAVVHSKWGNFYKYQSSKPDVKKAAKAYAKSAKLVPTYPFPLYELANIELEAQRPEVAFPHLVTANKLNPTSLLFANNLGVAQMQLKKPQEAIQSFSRVLELAKTSFSHIKGLAPVEGAHYNLALAHEEIGSEVESVKHFEAAMYGNSYDYSMKAAVKLRDNKQLTISLSEVQILLSDILTTGGRVKEASLRYADAYRGTNSTDLRKEINRKMRHLSKIWPARHPLFEEDSSASNKDEPKIEIVKTTAEGTTERVETKLTQKMLKDMASNPEKLKEFSARHM